jgi:hypothetical protein
MTQQVDVRVFVLRMELLKNRQQTHDETRPVTFDGFVRLPLHERTGMRTEIQGLK